MGQLIRQISVVVGLTVILTFPVTVVSGAGSQKQSDSKVHSAATEGKARMQGVAMTGAKPENAWSGRYEPRR